MSLVKPVVIDAMNEDFLMPFRYEEVKVTLFQMYHTKSLGLDGLPPLFFHKFWHIIREDFIVYVFNFFK